MDIIKNFLNKDGIVKSWPSKRNKKEKVLDQGFRKDVIHHVSYIAPGYPGQARV